MNGSPETIALRKRAGYLDAEAARAETEGWDKSAGRSPSLLRVIAAEFRAVAEIADWGSNFTEALPDGTVVHVHVPGVPCAWNCPVHPDYAKHHPQPEGWEAP